MRPLINQNFDTMLNYPFFFSSERLNFTEPGVSILTSVTKKAWKPYGTLLGSSTMAIGSGDIVFASITFTYDFLHYENEKYKKVRRPFSKTLFLETKFCLRTQIWKTVFLAYSPWKTLYTSKQYKNLRSFLLYFQLFLRILYKN